MAPATDAPGLLQRAQAGDREAFESLIRPLVEPGYGLAFTLLGHRQDAEDAVQEGVIKAWTKLRQARSESSVRAWFLQIVANECRMSRRQRWSGVIKVPEFVQPSGPSEDELAQAADLHHALRGLSLPDRLVLYLFYGLDLELEETATILRLSPSAAKARLYRAVNRLRPRLHPRGRTEA
ncbi:MAG: RNA polymerase sigma factor [Candidatus Dormibacteraeota bacterium]|nr:RNA polymerase sigma factor [Candidatus Dormibacteraeota bacterium]